MSGYTTKRQHNGDKWAYRQVGLPGADLALYASWISCTSWPWPASDLYCRLQLGLSGMRWSVRERMKHSYVCYIKTHTDSQLQSLLQDGSAGICFLGSAKIWAVSVNSYASNQGCHSSFSTILSQCHVLALCHHRAGTFCVFCTQRCDWLRAHWGVTEWLSR